MNENRRQILEMLAAGKITADEAERLLAALDPVPTPRPDETSTTNINADRLAGLLHTAVDHATDLLHTAAAYRSKKVGGIA